MIKVSMRLFQRENGIWYVEFKRGHKKSLRTRNKAEAVRLFNKLKREYLAGKLIVLKEGRKVLLSEFIPEYLDWARENLAPATYRKRLYVLNNFKEIVGDTYLKSLTRKHLDEYVSHLLATGVSRNTVNTHIRHLKASLTKAVEWEFAREHPFKGYKLLRVQQKPPTFLFPEQIGKVLKVIDDEFWVFVFKIFIYTGMRLSEVANLRWNDVDLRRGVIVVKKTKNYQTRIIPIHPKLREEIEKRLPAVGKVVPCCKDYIYHKIKNYLKKAGFPNVRIHDLRHTFASLMVMSGVDLKTVQELLGHRDYRTTEIYAHLAPAHLQDAIRKLPI
ncbi:tyrosine-type recombinase/integrase [Desulfurobacterium sp.]